MALANSLLESELRVIAKIKIVAIAEITNGNRNETSRLKKFIDIETIVAPRIDPIGPPPVPKNL